VVSSRVFTLLVQRPVGSKADDDRCTLAG